MSGVNSINGISKVTYKPVFKQNPEEKPTENKELKDVSMSGTEALANYNFANINKNNDFDIPKAEIIDVPNDLNAVEGEKIYNSKGELVCVSKTDGNLKTTYFTEDGKTEIEDINSGKLLKAQGSSNFDNAKFIRVWEYKDNGNVLESAYEEKDGKVKLNFTEKIVKLPDGTEKRYFRENRYGGYTFDEAKPSAPAEKTAIYDENGKLKAIIDHKSSDKSVTDIVYRNNKPFALKHRNNERLTLVDNENIFEKCKNDKDLTPAENFVIPENPADLEGEKTYYSNGVLETNLVKDKDKETLYKFDFKGNLVSAKSGNKTVETHKKDNKFVEDVITEELKDGGVKETVFTDGGLQFVKYSKDNAEKSVTVDAETGKIKTYVERNADGKSVCFDFDSDGKITDMFDFEVVEEKRGK